MIWANWAAAYCGLASGIHLTSLAAAAVRLGRPKGSSPATSEPGVSLLRPVCGIDNFATETLASSFCIDYPTYELIFCAARADDPVVPVVRRLIEAHERPAQLLIGDDWISANPKLNNIVKGWNAARHDWIVVADSNVLMPPDCLRSLLARWEPESGAVCSMPIGAQPDNFAAELECAFLNTLQARAQYVSELLGFGFAQGKTILFRRDIVERAGGIAALTIDAAEDAATTKLVRAAGLRVHLVDRPFKQPLGWRTARSVWSRQLRWARLRRRSFPWLFLPEILAGGALPAAAAGLAARAYGLDVATVLLVFLSLWFGAELALAKFAGWHCSRRLVLALVVRDLLLPALWLGALCGREFVWRGNAMRAGTMKSPPMSRRRRTLAPQPAEIGPEV